MKKSEIKIAILKNVTFFKISGHAGAENADTIIEAFNKSIKNSYHLFIIDMAECDYIDSTFIGTLLVMNKNTNEHKGKMVLLNITNQVYEILHNMFLDKFFNIETSDTFKNLKSLKDIKHRKSEKDMLENMIKAHEELSSTSQKNKETFQDLVLFLKSQKIE
ncbi:MAG: STAS domain-containing protein [Candidatus Muirbacterium halophilum]|nr:STAS domain-containing protein [Candidatus Muirbacterium halophilum]